jgi:glycosyltransferase involved in cell wall biosynthesis
VSAAPRRTLVALAEVAWGYFRTRKQFLLTRLAARGWRVVYVEPMAAGRGNALAAREVDGVTVVTAPFLKSNTRQPLYNAAIELPPVRAALASLGARAAVAAIGRLGLGPIDVAFLSNIHAAKALSGLGARLVCYDFNDHPLQFAGVPAWARGSLDRALERADLVLAVSAHYARQLAAGVQAPVVLLGNGVEYAHFARPGGEPPAAIRQVSKPRVGYVGKVSHFLDFAVLERLATTGGYELVIVGPLPDETAHDIDRLRRAPHAHVLGEVPYADVPAALAGLDVALIPFRAGDPFTVGINPNKLYQYWAAGLPIVSSPISDVAAEPSTLVFADGPVAFEHAVRDVLAAPRYPEAARARARAHDWDAIAERLDGLLEAALAGKARHGRVEAAAVAGFGDDVRASA